MNIKRYSFDELVNMAALDGIAGNRVSVGIWAKCNGYIKKCTKDKNRHNYYYYIKIG